MSATLHKIQLFQCQPFRASDGAQMVLGVGSFPNIPEIIDKLKEHQLSLYYIGYATIFSHTK